MSEQEARLSSPDPTWPVMVGTEVVHLYMTVTRGWKIFHRWDALADTDAVTQMPVAQALHPLPVPSSFMCAPVHGGYVCERKSFTLP